MENIKIVLNYIKNNKKNSIIILLILMLIILCIGSIYLYNKEPKVKIVKKEIVKKVKVEDDKKIIVDIKGCVKHQGIYEVKKDSRINDVIKLAGGLTDNANTEYINLSKKIEDEMVIYIYSEYEISKLKTSEKIKKENDQLEDENLITTNKEYNKTKKETEEITSENKLININTATLEELQTLTGIGESKAKAIIEYREKTKFKTIEDIKEVSGIGDSLFDKIKENITV